MWGRTNLGRPDESEEARRRPPPREHRCPAPFGAIPAPCGEGRSRQPLGWGESGAPVGCRPRRIHLGQQTPQEAPAHATGSCPVHEPRAHGCAASSPNPRPGSPAHPRAHQELWSYLQLPTSRGLRGSSRITAPGPGTVSGISQGQRRISALQRARPSTPPVKIILWCRSQGSAAVTGADSHAASAHFQAEMAINAGAEPGGDDDPLCSPALGTERAATPIPGGGWGRFHGVRSDAAGARTEPLHGHSGATSSAARGWLSSHHRAAPGPVPSCTRAPTEPYWGPHRAILGPALSCTGATSKPQ